MAMALELAVWKEKSLKPPPGSPPAAARRSARCPASSRNSAPGYGALKVIGCSNLRGGGSELGSNKKLDLWLQLFYTKLKLIQAI